MVSVTVTVYSTFESAPKKTHHLPLTGWPSSTLTTTSRLAALKNQKAPVSAVSGMDWPEPVLPAKSFQVTATRKRDWLRQRAVGLAAQPAAVAFGAGRWSGISAVLAARAAVP